MAFHLFPIKRFSILAVCLILISCTAPTPTGQVEPPLTAPTEALAPASQAPQAVITPEAPVSEPTAATEPAALPTNPPAPTLEIIPTIIPPAGPTLAFLKDGDIWFLDEPSGQPYPLTITGDIISFAWAPGGERLAAFNGKTLCFVHRDGSVRTACLELGLNETQSKIERQIALSPDQRWIVLWNTENPQDEGAIGWMIYALDTTNITYRIQDPLDWGAQLAPENEPGGFTGQPLFLPDGTLIGTLSHSSKCSDEGCRYGLFEFDFDTHTFLPFPEIAVEGFSEGMRLLLSADGGAITNFGAFTPDCENYFSSVDFFNLGDQTRQAYNLEKEALLDMSLYNDLSQAVIARSAGCSQPEQKTWATTCGLVQDRDVYPMQIWSPETNQRQELAPGLTPALSPDNQWIAFRSCLAMDGSGAWGPSEETSPEIYLYNIASGEITRIESGAFPQWRFAP